MAETVDGEKEEILEEMETQLLEEDAITRATYEDPVLVAGYKAATVGSNLLAAALERFALSLPGKHVLDAGCGPGEDSWDLAARGFEVVGIDFSAEMIRQARALRNQPRCPTFLRGNMERLGEMFASGSFDGIWCSASLLHLGRLEARRVLRTMQELLTPKGSMLLRLKEGVGEELRSEFVYGTSAIRRFVYWTENEIREAVVQAGFTVLAVERMENWRGRWLLLFLQKTAGGSE